jgi:hypothetical protein
VGKKPRPSLLDRFKPYLAQRINEGCLKASILHREITAQGFTGSYPIVRRFVERYRSKPDLTKVPRPPSVRQVTGWICRHPDNLVNRDTEQLQKILDRCPELRSADELVRSFANMMTHLHGERLTAWITAAEQAALPGISRFATGLNADLAAVTAGLSLALQLRTGRGQRQPHQDDQALDVRPRRLRPPPQTDPAGFVIDELDQSPQNHRYRCWPSMTMAENRRTSARAGPGIKPAGSRSNSASSKGIWRWL